MLELIGRFLLVGALAFGGGQAALPLVERLAVADTGWLSPQAFAVGVGLSYATPGPVLILAAFIGYHVAAVPGALAATAAVFAVPAVAAGFAAQLADRLQRQRWFRAFGQFAAAAAIGLLGVTLLSLAQPLIDIQPTLLLGSAAAFIAVRQGLHPVILIAAAATLGAAIAVVLD